MGLIEPGLYRRFQGLPIRCRSGPPPFGYAFGTGTLNPERQPARARPQRGVLGMASLKARDIDAIGEL
jgi:hypothetical protein